MLVSSHTTSKYVCERWWISLNLLRESLSRPNRDLNTLKQTFFTGNVIVTEPQLGFSITLWFFFIVSWVKGVLESFLGTAVTGAIFCLLAGQPLIILSSTGPVLVFERLLFNFSRCLIIFVHNVISQTVCFKPFTGSQIPDNIQETSENSYMNTSQRVQFTQNLKFCY